MKRTWILASFVLAIVSIPYMGWAQQQSTGVVYSWPDSLNGKSINVWDITISKRGDVFVATVGDAYYPGPVYRTSNDGQDWINLWRNVNSGLVAYYGFGIIQDPKTDALLLGATDGISRSTDNGKTWQRTPIPTSYPFPQWDWIRRFALKGDTILAGSAISVLASVDGGATWANILPASVPIGRGFVVMDICVAPSGAIFAATSHPSGPNPGVLRSTDGGKTWGFKNNGMENVGLYSVACDGNGKVYAGTSLNGLYQSTDNGESWQKVAYTGYRDVSDILVVSPDDVFLAVSMDRDSSGVLRYHNGTWSKIRVPALSISLAQKGNTLFVGTWDGVYRVDGVIDSPTAVNREPQSVPMGFALRQNYPNPFNPTTTIEFSIPKRANVILMVYNTIGQKVETIVSGELNSGIHQYVWNTGKYPSGIYFSVLETANFKASRKMLLVK